MDTEKASLGIMPRDIQNHKRWTELSKAMQHIWKQANLSPKEWMDKYIELCKED